MTHPGPIPPPPWPPPDDFTVPQATAKRIPDDLPFTVRPDRKKAIILGVMTGLVSCCPFSLGISRAVADNVSSGPAMFAVGAVVFLILIAAGVTTMVASLTSGGPMLGCDYNGVWVRTRQFPSRAMHLPWRAIRIVHSRQFLIQTMVGVSPLDPNLGRGLGPLAAIERLQQSLLSGSRFAVPTLHADHDALHILHAIAHFSQGRCHIQLPR